MTFSREASQAGGRARWGNKTAEERFWEKVDKSGECWTWTAALGIGGYGRISIGNNRYAPAHRRSWEIHFGPIPDGLLVCHRCDNPPCVNPAHLFLGSSQDNSTDMVEKGRSTTAQRVTHCPYGHPATPENWGPKSKCRTCDRERAQARRDAALLGAP